MEQSLQRIMLGATTHRKHVCLNVRHECILMQHEPGALQEYVLPMPAV